MKLDDKVKYIVKIKDEFVPFFEKTTLSKKGVFCGMIIQKGDQMIFELNGPFHANVIIPCSWIEWLAPSCIYFAQFENPIEEEKEEEYPYELYYCGEKVGKIKLPLPLFSLNKTDKSWEIK